MTGFSKFSFLRRVRIHDEDCGAVARALHHAVKGLSLYQADSRKVLESTNERKQMSTKTTLKRIALVAVSALGFGLMSIVPVQASVTITGLTVTSPTINRAATSGTLAITIENDLAQSDSLAASAYTVRVLTVPTGTANTVEVGDLFQTAVDTLTAEDTTTMTLGRANTLTIGGTARADAAIAGAIADNDTITVTTVAAASGAANLNTGDSAETWVDIAPNINGLWDSGTESIPTGASDDYFNTAGAYTFAVWFDYDGDAVVDADELGTYTTFSATFGGAPTSITITPSATTIAAGVDSIVKVYVYDSGSRLTRLSGTEGIRLTASNVTGTATRLLTVEGAAAGDNIDDADQADWTTAIADDRTYVEVNVDSDAGGSIRVTGQFFGGPAPLATAASSGTIVVNAASNATALSIATAGITTNQYRLVAPTALSALTVQTDTVFVNAATTRSVAFTISGTAGTNVNVTLGAVTDSSESLTAGVTSVAIGSAGTGTYTVAPTTVTAATTYTVTVPYAAGNLVYTIDFMAPLVDCAAGAGNCGITTTGIPSGVTKDVKSPGATTSYTVVVKDQFGTAYSGYKVTLTTASTARNASLNKEGFTDSTGSAVVSYTDASTSTTNLTDALTLKVFAPSDLTTNIFDVGNAITLDYSGALGSLTLSGGSTSTTTVKREVVNADAIDDTTTATAETVAIDNTLLSSTTGAVTGYATVYTGSAGLLFIADADNDGDITDEGDYTDAESSVTVANDNQVFVLSTKTGVGTITVTAGGLTKTTTVTFTQVANGANARNIAIAAGSATGDTGKMVSVSATVTDGHGNALEGATVTFVRSGGRFVTGASSVNVTTDASGVAAIDVTADTASTVTVTASLPNGTHAESDDIANTPVTGYAAASGAKSTSIAFSVSTVKSAEVLAAEAAEAEAKKATTEATAATAAAKAASEAAVAAAKAAEAAAKAAGDAAVAAAQKAATDAVAAAKAAEAAAVAKSEEATDASLEAIDAANAATDAANLAAEAADAATVAAEEARDAADAATAAVEALASEVSTLIAGLKAQITTLANTVAKIAKKVRA